MIQEPALHELPSGRATGRCRATTAPSHPRRSSAARAVSACRAFTARPATQQANYDAGRHPWPSAMALAPIEMAWQGKSLGEICTQIKDPARNGGRTMAELVHHMAEDDWSAGAGTRTWAATGARLAAGVRGADQGLGRHGGGLSRRLIQAMVDTPDAPSSCWAKVSKTVGSGPAHPSFHSLEDGATAQTDGVLRCDTERYSNDVIWGKEPAPHSLRPPHRHHRPISRCHHGRRACSSSAASRSTSAWSRTRSPCRSG